MLNSEENIDNLNEEKEYNLSSSQEYSGSGDSRDAAVGGLMIKETALTLEMEPSADRSGGGSDMPPTIVDTGGPDDEGDALH